MTDHKAEWVAVSDALPNRPGWYVGLNYGHVEPLRFDGANWHHTRVTRDLAMPSHWASFESIQRPGSAAPAASEATINSDGIDSKLIGAASEGEDVRLWDSQWVNVVNHANCYEDFTKEEAVAHAVKMTEQYMRSNITAGFPSTRPAAQVAATPKHDEGREELLRAAEEIERGHTWITAQGASAIIRKHAAALATQPAARRVTDDPRVAELIAAGRQLAGVNALMTGEPDRDAATWHDTDSRFRAALESFAQPAEGVSRKKHDGPCWRNSHADCGC